MSPKQLFLRTVKDANKLASVVQADGFLTTLIFCRAEVIERHTDLTPQHLEGIRWFIATLLDMGEPDQPLAPVPEKALRHDLERKSLSGKAENR